MRINSIEDLPTGAREKLLSWYKQPEFIVAIISPDPSTFVAITYRDEFCQVVTVFSVMGQWHLSVDAGTNVLETNGMPSIFAAIAMRVNR